MRRLGDLRDRLPRSAHEPGAEKQVLGRVAGDAELWEQDELGTGAAEVGVLVENGGTINGGKGGLAVSGSGGAAPAAGTVFAIDPFKGRLAIYDPGLSIFVTQSLPNLGLPFHAEAILDARNLFDFQTSVSGEFGSLRTNVQARMLRGGT